MSAISNVQGVERALDALHGTVTHAHIYCETDSLEEAIDGLCEEGFELIQRTRKKYVYQERGWFWQVELALGGVAVHLRCPA